MRRRASRVDRRLVAAAVAIVVLLATSAACGRAANHRPGAAPVNSSRHATTTVPASTSTTVAPTTVAPTTAAPTTVPLKPPPPPVSGAGVAIGDSVLEDVALYAPSTLQSHNIAINAAVGRQWPIGVGIVAGLRARGKLPPVVIVALGSNGRISAGQFDQMMQACAGAKRVVFMTVTGPLIGNNPIIAAGVARYPAAAVLADWNTVATAHPDWLAPDHVHVGPAGAAALGNLLASYS